jgi:hypothetical protein
MKKISKEAYEHALKIKNIYEDQNSFLAGRPEEKEEKSYKKVIKQAIKDLQTKDGIGLDDIVRKLKSIL